MSALAILPRPVALAGLATASAPHELNQAQAAEIARAVFEPRFPGFDRMAPVFLSAGVHNRQLAMPAEWYLQPLGWPERMKAYADAGLDLFCRAAEAALDEAQIKSSEVDAIVTISSTGVVTPSLEARAMQRMGWRPDAVRIPVFGLGCAGGVAGLALGSRLAAGWKDAVVLVVAVELCSLAFRMEGLTKADIVAAALFGDGAAAAVLRSGDGGFAQVLSAAEHTWPDTLDVMGWRIDPDGLGVIFAQSIPPFARRHLRPAMDHMLQAQELALGDVDRFICHPGGVKVMEALETSLELGQGALDHEREVLGRHGNMSAPTVLFVLDRARSCGMPPRSVATALGPGFTASTVALAA